MAKVSAPLLSFGASGAIAKVQVYFPWKGINAVRKYVIPSNPKSDAQMDQRDLMTEAVAGIHEAMANPDAPINAVDKSAWSLLAAVQGIIMTWFNALTRMIINQRVAGKDWTIFGGFTVTPGTDKLTVTGFGIAYGTAAATDGKLWYGTSKSAMLSSIACTVAELTAGKVIGTLTTGTKYYVQYRPTVPANQTDSNSGIYAGTPT